MSMDLSGEKPEVKEICDLLTTAYSKFKALFGKDKDRVEELLEKIFTELEMGG